MAGTRIKKDDKVIIISGNEKGKSGKVLFIDIKKNRAIVEGINLRKKTVKRKSEQDKGGIVQIEGSIALSNLMVLDSNNKTSKVFYKFEDKKKLRCLKTTGEIL